MLVGLAVPAAALAPQALDTLRRAFAHEVAARLPRIVEIVGTGDLALVPGAAALVAADANALADGCQLLGDAAGARALRQVVAGVRRASTSDVVGAQITGNDDSTYEELCAAVDTAALLLGRWVNGAENPSAQT